VVALGRGGALETVRPGATGLLVDESQSEAFADAITAALDASWDPAAIRRHALAFSRRRFGDEMDALARETYGAPAGTVW
jgi:glycosyltransferase involved in cell wall biosynthesis